MGPVPLSGRAVRLRHAHARLPVPPWTQDKAITDGPSILRYVRDAATEAGIDKNIRYGQRVERAAWSTEDARWTVDAVDNGEPVRLTAGFLFVCSGYYHYDVGHTPSFPGIGRFGGMVIHPQQWPADLDYAGKKIVVIGRRQRRPAAAEKAQAPAVASTVS